jgi:hypothetical protein
MREILFVKIKARRSLTSTCMSASILLPALLMPDFSPNFVFLFLFRMLQMADMSPLDITTPQTSEVAVQTIIASNRKFLAEQRQQTSPDGPGGPNTSNFLTNDSISSDESGKNQLLYSKRRLSMGNDGFVLTNLEADDESKLDLDDFADELIGDKVKSVADSTDEEKRAKRRRSTLGFLDYIFSKTNSPFQDASGPETPKAPSPEPHPTVTPVNTVDDPFSFEPLDINSPDSPQAAAAALGDQVIVRKLRLASLDEAMAETQKTQQSIHDWDRKMGLKRSHSKTMRLSQRSRKKLRQQIKKDITSINTKRRRSSLGSLSIEIS